MRALTKRHEIIHSAIMSSIQHIIGETKATDGPTHAGKAQHKLNQYIIYNYVPLHILLQHHVYNSKANKNSESFLCLRQGCRFDFNYGETETRIHI